MELSKYISKLLFDHDCVTVYGFGSFLGNYNSAKYDYKEQKFYPPSKQISFNSQIKDNDGLLAKEISKSLNISYDEAVKKIHNTVLSWTKKIKVETLVIKNIGELYLNQDEKIIFIPSNELNHLKESFGLPPIFVRQIENEKSFEKYPPKKLKPKKNNYFVQAAVWACLIIGLTSLYFSEKNNIIEREMAFEEEYRNQTKLKAQKAIFKLGALPALTVNVKMKQKKYFIIAGAFRVFQNAENLVSNLKLKGYDASRLDLNDKGLSPVAFGSFTNRNEAVSELRLIQKKENKDAWIFEVN
jgi:hypothetical protein